MEALLLQDLPAILIAFTVAAFITWFSIPIVVRVASLKHLTDPPGMRKVHKKEIPTLGGVAIFAGFATGFLLSVDGYIEGVNYFSFSILLLFFVGIKDDLITLDPRKKLIAQIFAAICLIYFTDIRITSFHGLIGFQDIPAWLTYASTIFVIIVIINAVNLSDGIDGNAASISIVSSLAFGAWFWLSGNTGYTIIAAALAGSLIAFLRFNLSTGKNKIFMGDTGSLITGFLLSVMAIRFNEINAGTSTYHDLYSAPAVSIAILIVPLFDTLRVFTIRIVNGQHPFTADNRHIHHLMLRAGFSHRRSSFIIAVTQILIIALAFYIDHIGVLWLSLVLITICLILTGVIYTLVYRNCLVKGISIRKIDIRMISYILIIHRYFRPKKKGMRREALPSEALPDLADSFNLDRRRRE